MKTTFEKLINVLVEDKIINERSLRDYRIMKEYVDLRIEGVTCRKAREILANKYEMTEKNIQHILYTRVRK